MFNRSQYTNRGVESAKPVDDNYISSGGDVYIGDTMKVKEIIDKDQREISALIAALEEKVSNRLKESFPNGFVAITQNQYFDKKGSKDTPHGTLHETGVFKAVLRDGRIEIPEVELGSLDLSEGDVVMCMIRKIPK